MTGYLHPGYAQSLAEYGVPRELPRCGGWVLERRIPGTDARDAMGCYPLFCCRDWSQLQADLDARDASWVSLSVVADPFGNHDESSLRRCFRDKVIHFKEAYVIELHRDALERVSSSHRKKARKALTQMSVEVCADPQSHLEEWDAMYAALATRHQIAGMRRFSKDAFARQLAIPGLVMFRALVDGVPIGSTCWYLQDRVGFGHLAAFTDQGYALRASYALDAYALEHFRDDLDWLYLGGGPGVQSDAADGLSMYKRGWSTGTKPLYFCGRIFDRVAYDRLAGQKSQDYFPAYRAGEFA